MHVPNARVFLVLQGLASSIILLEREKVQIQKEGQIAVTKYSKHFAVSPAKLYPYFSSQKYFSQKLCSLGPRSTFPAKYDIVNDLHFSVIITPDPDFYFIKILSLTFRQVADSRGSNFKR